MSGDEWLLPCPVCGNKPNMIAVSYSTVKIVCPTCQLSAMAETMSNSWWDLERAAQKALLLWGTIDEIETRTIPTSTLM